MNKVTPTRTIRVGAREANQQFSKLLREVEAGAEVIISRNGDEVAKLLPSEKSAALSPNREQAIQEVLAMMDRLSFNSGGYKFNREDAYEELYERFDRRQRARLHD